MKKIQNHKWQCARCGVWIGEDYNECSICEIKELAEAKKINLKNLILSNWDLLSEHRKRLFTLKFQGKRDCEIAKIFGVSRQAIFETIRQSLEKIELERSKKQAVCSVCRK
jgi:predicted DNA-binding protein YlxM (UPF0122 family)